MDSKQTEKKTDDRCPEWAAKQIAQLREVEVYLGNIPKALEWESSHLNDVAKRSLSKEHSAITERTSELVFSKIVKSLNHEGFSLDEIESFINTRISYKGGPKYCSRLEVEEAL